MYGDEYLPYFWRYCRSKTLGCRAGGIRTGWMQERTNAGKEGCMKGGSPDWRDTGKEGSGQERYLRSGRDATVDRRDKGKLGGRTGGMQD